MASGVYKRNSSNNGWIDYNNNNQIRVRNSANNGWLTPPSSGMIFRRNGNNNGWIQIYPLGIVSSSTSGSVGTGGMNTKQSRYTSWKTGVSRQGWNKRSSGGYEQFGVINHSSSGITGRGSITSSGSWAFSGTLNSSGNYNYNQTITFRGCSYTGGTGSNESPFGTYDNSGSMTYSWKATGANTAIPYGGVSLNGSAALNWLNNTYSYGNKMCMYNGENSSSTGNSYSKDWSNNYLGISAYNMSISGYQYVATSYSLPRPASAPMMFSMSDVASVPKEEDYLKVALPLNYEFDSTEDLLYKYETEEIEYVTSDQAVQIQETDYKPVVFSIDNNIVYTSPIFEEHHIVQYFYEDEWINSINTEPRQFLIREGTTKVRIINIKTDEVFYEICL
jgi:hypothetical protein